MWERILCGRESEDGEVRHEAGHAVQTLSQRAARDPRAWELLRDLEAEHGGGLLGSVVNIGLWGPRHRPSRRKRMAPPPGGSAKARASLEMRL